MALETSSRAELSAGLSWSSASIVVGGDAGGVALGVISGAACLRGDCRSTVSNSSNRSSANCTWSLALVSGLEASFTRVSSIARLTGYRISPGTAEAEACVVPVRSMSMHMATRANRAYIMTAVWCE